MMKRNKGPYLALTSDDARIFFPRGRPLFPVWSGRSYFPQLEPGWPIGWLPRTTGSSTHVTAAYGSTREAHEHLQSFPCAEKQWITPLPGDELDCSTPQVAVSTRPPPPIYRRQNRKLLAAPALQETSIIRFILQYPPFFTNTTVICTRWCTVQSSNWWSGGIDDRGGRSGSRKRKQRNWED